MIKSKNKKSRYERLKTEKVITLKQAQKVLPISYQVLVNWAQAKKIPAFQIHRNWFIFENDLKEFVNEF